VTSPAVTIAPERPDSPPVLALLASLDRYLASLYPPEANHILGVEALLAPEVTFLVARADGQALGCGAVRTMPGEPDTDAEPYGEIKRMYVEPAARGLGIGGRLIDALEAALLGRGVGLSLLETGGDQHEAVRLYERKGYVRRAAFGGYPDNGLSVFMQRRLGSEARP
jgi:putative acetyltransferase